MLLNCGSGEDCCETLVPQGDQPVNPKGNQPWRGWFFLGRTDDEAEAPILRPPDMKKWLFEKDPDAGKDGRQVKKGTKEDKMVGWHRWLNGHEFEQTPRNSEGQGTLVCCCPCGCKVLDTTQHLNNSNLYPYAGGNKMLCFIFHVFSFTTMHLWHWRKCTWLVHCL